MIANWDEELKQAEFTKDVVFADDSLDGFLDNPAKAFEKIFGPRSRNTRNYPELDWKNHIFCQKIVIAQLCAWAGYSGGDLMKTLEDLKHV